MVAKNKRKLEILRLVLEAGELTSEEVGDAFEMEIHNARMPLRRYWKSGLLYRRVVDKKRCSEEDRKSKQIELKRILYIKPNSGPSFDFI